MKIQKNISLENLSSFHTSGTTKNYVEITLEEDVISLIQQKVFLEEFYLLGSGYNTLFSGDFDGFLVKNTILGIEKIYEDKKKVRLRVGGGEDWVKFVQYCVENNYAGVENLSEIPGTVGAAPVQNIGAYGIEVAEVVYEVQGIDLFNGEKKRFSSDACNFGYRESIFKLKSSGLKNKFIITYVVFELEKYTSNYILHLDYADIQNYIKEKQLDKEKMSIKKLSEIITTIRQGKLPNLDVRGTAGSFFKNPIILEKYYVKLLKQFPMLKSYPVCEMNINGDQAKKVKIPAAQLIELVGMKGVLEDGVGTYKNHALILVSQGIQDGKKIVDFSENIQKKVKNTFNINLEPEVNIIGGKK